MLAASSLLISLAALAVAAFSVYTVSLRHANIEVDVTMANVSHSASSGGVPTTSTLTFTLMASNDGARAGLIGEIGIADIRPNVPLWARVEPPVITPRASLVMLQANEAQEFQGHCNLPNLISDDPVSLEEFVSRLERLEVIEVIVEWSYDRSAGLPFAAARLPPMLRRRREHVERTCSANADVHRYRSLMEQEFRYNGKDDMADRVAPPGRRGPPAT